MANGSAPHDNDNDTKAKAHPLFSLSAATYRAACQAAALDHQSLREWVLDALKDSRHSGKRNKRR